VGLAWAIKWFTENGYLVSIPLTDSQDYDLVVDHAGTLYKVQVRTTYSIKRPSGNYQLNLQVTGGNRSGTGKVKHFDPSKVDLIFALTNAGTMYLIPSIEVEARRSLSLCHKYNRFRVT
jgi:hypothetical protein